MAAKKDFGTASRGLLGLDNTSSVDNATEQEINNKEEKSSGNASKQISKDTKGKKEIRIKTSVELSEENLQFIDDIKTIEGGSIRTVLNGLLDDLRISKRAALDKALEIHNQGRKTWKDV
jgi:hypothetical protein